MSSLVACTTSSLEREQCFLMVKANGVQLMHTGYRICFHGVLCVAVFRATLVIGNLAACTCCL